MSADAEVVSDRTVEIEQRRPRLRTVSSHIQPRPSRQPVVRTPGPPLPVRLPTFAVRETVERTANRRNSSRMIATYLKAGDHAAVAAERAAWAADAVRALVADGYARDAAEVQVAGTIGDMLIGVVPRGGPAADRQIVYQACGEPERPVFPCDG